MSRLLDDKVAVVTGGGQGLGLATATALAVDGAKVLVVGRDEEKLRATAAKIRGSGGLSHVFATDLTAPGAPAATIGRALEEFGGVDILINCAGVFAWKRLFDLTEADWGNTISTNLTAPFLLSQEAARAMVEQERGGSIVNIASIHGLLPDPNVVAHCAAKAGLVGMTKAMAEALREYDIRVNAVAPGSIEPNSADRRGESPGQKVTQADIANLTIYLASDLSRSITGSVFEAFGSTRTSIKV